MSPRLVPPGGALRRMLDMLGDADAVVWEADPSSGRFLSVSDGADRLTGFPPGEWTDLSGLVERIHPEDRPALLDAWEGAREGRRLDVEYRFATRDGREVWLWQIGQLSPVQGGSRGRVRGLIVDVTERRHVEEERERDIRTTVEGRTREAASRWVEAEERFRALEQQVPAITYLDSVDPPQQTVAISEQTTTILGYTPDEWYADPSLWRKLVHPDDLDRLQAAERLGGFPEGIEYRMIAKDGRIVWVHDRSRLISDGEGIAQYWLGVLVDTTDRRRVHELRHELATERRENLRLAAADEAKTIALQAVSHDIRTPLAAILGLAVTLEGRAYEMNADEVRDLSSRIVQNSRRLDRIVTDLLDLDRLQRGGLVPRLEALDLGALVRDLVTRADVVTERRLQLDTSPVHVRADPTMVERIVENLLTNAMKHTPGDSRIWVRVERSDAGALITVEDDGPGIAPQLRDRIFEPFAQGPTPGQGGAGIGLALVTRFAELHDGRAWVQERPGGGASFRVLLAYEPVASDLLILRDDAQPTGTDGSGEESQA